MRHSLARPKIEVWEWLLIVIQKGRVELGITSYQEPQTYFGTRHSSTAILTLPRQGFDLRNQASPRKICG